MQGSMEASLDHKPTQKQMMELAPQIPTRAFLTLTRSDHLNGLGHTKGQQGSCNAGQFTRGNFTKLFCTQAPYFL